MNNSHHFSHHNSTRGFGLMEKFLAKKRVNIAEKLIDDNLRQGRILDVGCGSFPHFLLSTKFKEKYGVDLAVHDDGILGSSTTLKNVDIEHEPIPFPKNYFDVIVMLAVFEHISPEKLPSFLQQTYNMLKKGGILIVTTPSPHSKYILWLLSRINLISKVEINDHKSSFTINQILSFMQNAGFKKHNIIYGSFELSFNIWLKAVK